MSPSVPIANALLQVKELWKSRPCEKRFTSLVWSALYQESPSGDQCMLVMLLNCGNGRSDWATDAVSGKPAYGGLPNPREMAVAELIGDPSRVRSAGLFRLR